MHEQDRPVTSADNAQQSVTDVQRQSARQLEEMATKLATAVALCAEPLDLRHERAVLSCSKRLSTEAKNMRSSASTWEQSGICCDLVES